MKQKRLQKKINHEDLKGHEEQADTKSTIY